MKPLILFAVLIFFLGPATEAQNIKFSQYENAPLILNPAATGKFEGQLRLGVLASRQAAGKVVLNHGTVFGDYRLEQSMGHLGIGVSYYQNAHPDFQLTSRFVGLSLAQHFFMDYDEFHEISLGAQVAVAGSRLDPARPMYDKQITAGGNNTPYAPGNKKGFADVNLGLLYTFHGDEVTVETGVSAYQLLNPNDGNGFSLGRRIALSADAGFTLSPYTTMHLSALMWKEGLYLKAKRTVAPTETESLWGVLMESLTNGSTSVLYGLSTRNVKTVLAKGGLGLGEGLRLMASYELPLNKEVYRVSRGEVSVVYSLDQSR